MFYVIKVSYFSIVNNTVTKEKEFYIKKDDKIIDLITLINDGKQFEDEINEDKHLLA